MAISLCNTFKLTALLTKGTFACTRLVWNKLNSWAMFGLLGATLTICRKILLLYLLIFPRKMIDVELGMRWRKTFFHLVTSLGQRKSFLFFLKIRCGTTELLASVGSKNRKLTLSLPRSRQ